MGLGLLNTENDARAFIMIDINATADIKDANMFYRELTENMGGTRLTSSAKKAIDETEEALRVFRGVFGFVEPPNGTEKEKEKALEVFREGIKPKGIRRKLKWILSDRRAARSLSIPLQYAQSNLSRRVDWIGNEIKRWNTLPFGVKEERNLPSSMPPKPASTKPASSVPPAERD